MFPSDEKNNNSEKWFEIISERKIHTGFFVVDVTVWDTVKKESNRPCCVVVRAFANFLAPLRIRSSLEEEEEEEDKNTSSYFFH